MARARPARPTEALRAVGQVLKDSPFRSSGRRGLWTMRTKEVLLALSVSTSNSGVVEFTEGLAVDDDVVWLQAGGHGIALPVLEGLDEDYVRDPHVANFIVWGVHQGDVGAPGHFAYRLSGDDQVLDDLRAVVSERLLPTALAMAEPDALYAEVKSNRAHGSGDAFELVAFVKWALARDDAEAARAATNGYMRRRGDVDLDGLRQFSSDMYRLDLSPVLP